MRSVAMVALVLSLVVLCFQLCSARDTLKAGENITKDSGNLVSFNRTFELGFFSPSSSNNVKSYLGIWYHGLKPQTVVWVANRDTPILDSTGVFRIAENGKLVVEAASSKTPYWTSDLEGSSSENRTLKLLDSGNLVLIEGTSYTWQSFQNPTDTFLHGMIMDANLTLISWRDTSDPARGDFTFKLAGSKNYVVERQSQLYFSLDVSGTRVSELLDKASSATSSSHTSRSRYDPSRRPFNFENSRLVMNSSGEIQFLKLDKEYSQWDTRWHGPVDKCEIHNFCGSFEVCNKINLNLNLNHCQCLPGFTTRKNGETQDQGGCVRKSESCIDTEVTFLNLTKVKVDDPDQEHIGKTEAECQSLCLNNNKCLESQCQAYSFGTIMSMSSYNRMVYNTCKIWMRDLSTLVEGDDGGVDLSVLVKRSDLVPSAKWCEPCGTNLIPYPLSTGPNCGDPTYNKLHCSSSTGQVSFLMPQGISYPVTNIDEDSRMIFITINVSYSCSTRYQYGTPNFPFNITECNKDVGFIKINWLPAPEPPCSEPKDCENWPHSTCKAEKEGGSRCSCDSKFYWDDSIMRCTKLTKEDPSHRLALIVAVSLTGIAIMSGIMTFATVWRKKTVHKLDRANTQIQESLYESERHVRGLIGLGSLEEKDIEGIEVPCYTFASILAATDNFSDSNKLGRGGYGPVYKGTFPGGQDIAVKRLSSVSTQGLQEFKNEVILIAKLQHRNLVRLRGYCIKGDEKILLYEYMPNKSLDSFIFDRTGTLLLDWPMRFEIIVGIARGMLYLHQDSRLRVIHRDLKTSNVLLDEEMNPKISDFGLAKIFGGKETEASTQRVVGTYGYMAPEYALDGLFSIKSDVFSFGVVLLEILSGKKNTGFYQSNQISSLLGYAWMLWTENRLLDLMDASLGETCKGNQFIKCAHVGLLCIQDEPSDRPTMSNVLAMLEIEVASMPIPKQPTFFANKRFSSSASSSSKPEITLQFESSYREGR